LLVIREAHTLKEPEVLESLMGPAASSGHTSVCVFLSKDLDARKKFSKKLIEKAAVVPCDAIAEEEREAWVDYLAKRRGLALDAGVIAQLRSMDPWSLDLLDLELEKFELSEKSPEVLLGSAGTQGGSDVFFEAFFFKDLKKALELAESFSDKTEESLPLLGLFSWNVRYLSLFLSEKNAGVRELKLNPYLADKLSRWSRKWSLAELLALQEKLHELDFALKQTPKHPLGAWSDLMIRFL
jgi:DNA polymerase III delta subunit